MLLYWCVDKVGSIEADNYIKAIVFFFLMTLTDVTSHFNIF